MTKLRRGRAVLTIDEMEDSAAQCREWNGWDSGNEEWALEMHLLEAKDVQRLIPWAVAPRKRQTGSRPSMWPTRADLRKTTID